MARKPRDYKAEERRRNELARQRGFKTRASQRGAIARGTFPSLQPSRITSPKTKAAQETWRLKSLRDITYDDIANSISKEEQCIEWARLYAMTTVCQYQTDKSALESEMDKRSAKHRKTYGAEWRSRSSATNAKKRKWIAKNGMDAYTDVYYRAFVSGPEIYGDSRGKSKEGRRWKGGSDAMQTWFVDVTGYLSADEYEKRYGLNSANVQ